MESVKAVRVSTTGSASNGTRTISATVPTPRTEAGTVEEVIVLNRPL